MSEPSELADRSDRRAAQVDDVLAQKIAKLTVGQRECLWLVFMHKSSKEISPILGVTCHAVDQRIKTACRTLDAYSRKGAACMLAAYEGKPPDHLLVYQASDVADASQAGAQTALQHEGSSARSDQLLEESRTLSKGSTARLWLIDLLSAPFKGGRGNDLRILHRLGWIAAIAFGSAIAFGAVLSGLDALTRLT